MKKKQNEQSEQKNTKTKIQNITKTIVCCGTKNFFLAGIILLPAVFVELRYGCKVLQSLVPFVIQLCTLGSLLAASYDNK